MAVVASRDQFILAQGDAGSGKTTVFHAVAQAASLKKISLLGLSKTGKAVKEFTSRTGAPGFTIDEYLGSKSGTRSDLRVIDEASMIGSRNMIRILDLAGEDKARTVFVGDVKQLLSIEAGRAFGDSQSHSGLKIIGMKESIRQKTGYARSLVEKVKEKDLDQAFTLMREKGRLHEEGSTGKRLILTRDLYLKSPEKSVVIVAYNREREALNTSIRGRLQAAGKIDPVDHKLSVRSPVNLPESDRRYASGYAEATHIYARQGFDNLKAGAEARVLNIDYDTHTMTVKSRDKEFQIDLVKYGNRLQAFRENGRNFSIGDRVIFTKNDKRLGVQNGLSGTIREIGEKGKLLVRASGKDVKIDTGKYQYIDHGYALTDYKSQGSTYQNVIFSGPAGKTNYNSFYVSASRIKEDFALVTNNLDLFRERAIVEIRKTSTLDHTLDRRTGELTKNVLVPERVTGKDFHKRGAPKPGLERSPGRER